MKRVLQTQAEGAECRLPADVAEAEATCPRCGAEMTWTKASWHCLACRYKEGCCG